MSGTRHRHRLAAVVDRIRASAVRPPPPPWRHVGTFRVGGLTSVGFDDGSDVLLVVSAHGRGVFDCLTGDRLARDRNLPDPVTEEWDDPFTLEAPGVGPLAGRRVRICGLYGGGLPVMTRDGWQAERLVLDWPDETLVLTSPGSSVFAAPPGRPAVFTKVAVRPEVRAWGFSSTGRSLVLASSGELSIFCRVTGR